MVGHLGLRRPVGTVPELREQRHLLGVHPERVLRYVGLETGSGVYLFKDLHDVLAARLVGFEEGVLAVRVHQVLVEAIMVRFLHTTVARLWVV